MRRASQIARSQSFNYKRLQSAGIPADLIEDANASRIYPWLLALALHQKNYFLDNVLMETAESVEAWQKIKELLTEILEICKRYESQFIMVLFPASVQVNDSHFEFLQRLKFNMDKRTLESSAPQKL
ncbi:MAG: hypothetical protein WD688_19585 [Candidatus Binatia bacterium]